MTSNHWKGGLSMSAMHFRQPSMDDGAAVFQLIKNCPPLDVNSQYYYHIICGDFGKTCVVAERDNDIVGVITAYIKPQDPSCLFVWQVAVDHKARGKRLASVMLEWLTQQTACRSIKTVETTISPSNQASQNVFIRFAEARNAEVTTHPFLDASHFGADAHEDEVLYRISL